eukprot:gene7339-8737_t
MASRAVTEFRVQVDSGSGEWSGDSKLNLITLTSGDLAVAFNDMNQWEVNGKVQRNDRGRAHLKVAISKDHGQTWSRIARLEDGDNTNYYHYPTLMQPSWLGIDLDKISYLTNMKM